jgi:hypothetical protein
VLTSSYKFGHGRDNSRGATLYTLSGSRSSGGVGLYMAVATLLCRRTLHQVLSLALWACALADTAAAPGAEVSATTLLREGLYQEQTLRQPESASATYRKLIDAPGVPSSVRAEAHLRLGVCLGRVGQTDQARKQFELIVRQFADQLAVVEQAKQNLEAIVADDPATLMPPTTPVYLELVRPGLQTERFVASLKGLDEAGLETLINRLGAEPELRSLRNMLNQVVREDLTHIDSVALGVMSYEELPGRTKGKFLVVLHPGKSIAARGFIAMLAQTSGKPSGSHQDVKLWDIPDGPGGVLTFANLPDRPGLSAVVLVGKDRQVVCEAIDRYRAGARASSLASLPEFRRQAGARRRDSAVLLYVDVPRVLMRLQQVLDTADREGYQTSRQLFGLDNIERGMARVALLNDGVLLEFSLMFNEKENPFYAMWQTPPADRTLLGFIPTHTAAAALISLGDARQKWTQIRAFLEQLVKLGQLRISLGGKDPLPALTELEGFMGGSFHEDMVSNCRSLAIMLPDIAPSRSGLSASALANVVLALRMAKPDEFAGLLERVLLDHLQAGLQTGQMGDIKIRTYVDTASPSGVALRVARLGDVFLLSLSADMLERVLRSYKEADVMDRSELGRRAAEAIPLPASKIVLIRPDLVGNGLRAQSGQVALKLKPVRPVVAYTLEQANQAVLRIEVGDLTDVLNNVILAAGATVATTSSTATTAATTATTPLP